jgi:hypothetical protein
MLKFILGCLPARFLMCAKLLSSLFPAHDANGADASTPAPKARLLKNDRLFVAIFYTILKIV